VREANRVARRVAYLLEYHFVKKTYYILENPISSVLWRFKCIQMCLKRHGAKRVVVHLGAYGTNTLKPAFCLLIDRSFEFWCLSDFCGIVVEVAICWIYSRSYNISIFGSGDSVISNKILCCSFFTTSHVWHLCFLCTPCPEYKNNWSYTQILLPSGCSLWNSTMDALLAADYHPWYEDWMYSHIQTLS